MIIEISKISPEGSRYEGEEPPDILELDDDARTRPTGPIRYDLHIEKVGGELVVRGTLGVPFEIECSRCTDFFSTSLAVSSFLRAYEVPEGTETVDITEDIREDILLNLPPFPVCSPDCKGLCPKCGKNWNEGRCSCKPDAAGGGAWSALDKLKLN